MDTLDDCLVHINGSFLELSRIINSYYSESSRNDKTNMNKKRSYMLEVEDALSKLQSNLDRMKKLIILGYKVENIDVCNGYIMGMVDVVQKAFEKYKNKKDRTEGSDMALLQTIAFIRRLNDEFAEYNKTADRKLLLYHEAVPKGVKQKPRR